MILRGCTIKERRTKGGLKRERRKEKGEEENEEDEEEKNLHFVAVFSHQYFYSINNVNIRWTEELIRFNMFFVFISFSFFNFDLYKICLFSFSSCKFIFFNFYSCNIFYSFPVLVSFYIFNFSPFNILIYLF